MFRRFVIGLLTLLVTACAGTAPAATSQKIVVGMPYIPNIQFAHLYMAQTKGYFADAGLDVTFDYNFENDVVQRIATNNGIQFALASADSVLLARAQGLPVKAVMATSQEFPVAFISKDTTPITSPADLVGKTIGIPGRFGASYIGLQAILRAGNISEAEVSIQEIGFNQVPALLTDKVQVISGYANNEPIQLRASGTAVSVLRIADVTPLASDHVIVSESYLNANRDVVAKFTAALQKGMNDVAANPEAAYDATVSFIPEAKAEDKAVAIDVLKATVAMWQAGTTAMGVIHPAQWEQTHTLLRAIDMLKSDVTLADAYDVTFIKE